MPRSIWILFLVLIASLAAILVVGYSMTKADVYEASGAIVGFDVESGRVFVEHDSIPGLMPAMTMPFQMRNPDRLEGLGVGDLIDFRLTVRGGRTSVDGIRVTGSRPAPQATPRPSDSRHVSTGDPFPRFVLTDQDGERLDESWIAGSYALVNFIYTRCPLPDYCPLMSKRFERIQSRITPSLGVSLKLLSISIDPEFDQPAVLREYAVRYAANPAHWRFGVASLEATADMGSRLGVVVSPSLANPVDLDHGLVTMLVDPSGVVRDRWRGSEWTVDEILHRLDTISGNGHIQD